MTAPCKNYPDAGDPCLAVEVQSGRTKTTVGAGYSQVKRLWVRKPSASGPDVLLLGDFGGSGGNADLLALSFSGGLRVRKISGERVEAVTVESPQTPLRFDLPFAIGFFNGAPNAGTTIVPLPMRWVDGDFALDRKHLIARSFPPEDLRFRELAVQSELHQWASDSYPAERLFPPMAPSGTPVTVQALADLMLAGHADIARAILHKGWPRSSGQPMEGEDAFWAALCKVMVKNDLWQRFDLARVPNASLIEAAAKTAP